MNPQVLQVATIVIASIGSLGVLLAGAGFGYGKFYEGRNKQTLDETNLFSTRLDALKTICDDQANQILHLQNDIKGHTQEIGRLQGVNEEKEKKIKDLTDLLANRDPALAEYIKNQTESAKLYKPIFDQMIQNIKNIADAAKKNYEYLELVDGKLNKALTKGVI